MRIASWNVNGIRAVHKKDTFVPFLKKYKPDVVCLQETKAEQHQSPIDLPDYEEFWCSAKKKGYSGTAIFTKRTPENVLFGIPEDITHRHKLDADSYGDPAEEGRVIAADIGPFYVVSVYTPNSKEDLSRLQLRHKQWDPAFLTYMKRLEEEKPVIFCGDLNVAHQPIDLEHPKANEGEHGYTKEEREGIDKVIDAGFIDTYRHFYPEKEKAYTWWTHWRNARARNVGWRIDYIFASKSLSKHFESASIHPEVMGSDHCPVSLDIS